MRPWSRLPDSPEVHILQREEWFESGAQRAACVEHLFELAHPEDIPTSVGALVIAAAVAKDRTEMVGQALALLNPDDLSDEVIDIYQSVYDGTVADTKAFELWADDQDDAA